MYDKRQPMENALSVIFFLICTNLYPKYVKINTNLLIHLVGLVSSSKPYLC